MRGTNTSRQYAWITAGVLFAFLWGSASTATKIGLSSAQPLVISIVRFGIAAFIMLFLAHVLRGKRLPAGKEWRWLAIYGLLNITIYLGCYVIGMQEVTAGIGALAVAANPVFISFLSIFFLKKKLTSSAIIAILICMAGVVCAAWPLLGGEAVTTKGLLIILLSMLSYSVAAIYFSRKKWNGLSLFAINGWQTAIGGLLLSPFVLIYYKDSLNHFDQAFWLSVGWLAIPVSIFAVQLWLWLLQTDAVKAGLWLFLCPLFGFSIAAWMVKDRINEYTIAGTLLVLTGLFLSQQNIKRKL